ncbi:MAG: hypothetical protein FD174_3708 [Geobacteraceae bacterium]|nr:MAG: hypothetical protein FD174_3708 [Geobacteraceae bacterium]
MAGKKMVVTIYGQNHVRSDWRVDLTGSVFQLFFTELSHDLARYGIELSRADNDAVTIDINSYADLLNAVRISSPADGFTSLCVGHIIGKSQNLDLMEDIKRALDRVAFAPETIPPEDHNRQVCHNCGCGC